ncbi:alpha/beta fold hydrolase [Arenimonas fontis]|uniref:alpha/beta fold hydrolase n=1 Tax=Arenimonas fontis TaxID=2608255 RepID=UPI001661A1D7|nr:alpha/beta fold hydrolase [Arenimonas fontis]
MLVHGAGGGGWEWTVWGRVLAAAGMEVLAPDLQPRADGLVATALDDYAAQVDRWLRAAPRPRLLAGASLGGLLALMRAALADALVLVNPIPPEGLPGAVAGERSGRVPWGRTASPAGTRRALPDADAATCAWAWRRWRDESARVLAEARAGRDCEVPVCPVLVIASAQDPDVPTAVSVALAGRLGASVLRVPGSHVGPLLGRGAAGIAAQAVEWMNTLAMTPSGEGRIKGRLRPSGR